MLVIWISSKLAQGSLRSFSLLSHSIAPWAEPFLNPKGVTVMAHGYVIEEVKDKDHEVKGLPGLSFPFPCSQKPLVKSMGKRKEMMIIPVTLTSWPRLFIGFMVGLEGLIAATNCLLATFSLEPKTVSNIHRGYKP